jgi:rhodanese-related sulfurtransferase
MTGMYEQISAAGLARRLGGSDEPVIVDDRESDEVAGWAMPGARNIPLGELAGRVSELPRDRQVVTVCASGGRSAVAAAALAAAGWRAAGGGWRT